MALADNRAIPWTFVLDEPLRILVVDDDPILREFANVYLATPSATIDTACDGAAARAQLADNRYDLLLLDIEMPRLDGFSLLEEIRSTESLKQLPVIMLTGHDDIASIDRAYQLGANSFATKPVNWRQLSYQIRYVVRTSRADNQRAEPHVRPHEAGSNQTATATKQHVLDFLHSVIDGAKSLETQLAAQDRAHCSEPLQDIQSLARQAVDRWSRNPSPNAPAEACRSDRIALHVFTSKNQDVATRGSANAVDP